MKIPSTVGLRSFFRNQLISILTALIFIVIVMFVMFAFNLKDIHDEDFWLRAAVGYALQVLLIFLWYPEGKKTGRENELFKDHRAECNRRIALAAQPQHYRDLDKFCEYANKENMHTKLKRLCAEKRINYDLFIELNQKGRETELDWWLNQLTKKQRQFVDNLHKVEQPKPIKATQLTGNANIENAFDIENHASKMGAYSIAVKFVISAVTTFGGVVVAVGFRDELDWSVAYLIVYWLAVTLMSILFAIRTGINNVMKYEDNHLVRLIDFLDRFDGWLIEQGKPPIDKPVNLVVE